MRNKRQDETTKQQLAAVKAIAVASKSPFKVAFMATLGIAAAQIVSSLLFIAFAVGVVFILVALFN